MEDVVLVAGTQQNLSNLYSLDIYGLAIPYLSSIFSIIEYLKANMLETDPINELHLGKH